MKPAGITLVAIAVLRPRIRNSIAQKPTSGYKQISTELDMQMILVGLLKTCVQAETITDINPRDDKFIPL